MTRHQQSTLLLRIRLALLALFACALACPAPLHVLGQARPAAPSHQLEGDFLRFWNQHDGARTLGPPLSAPIWLDGRLVQLFAHTRLEQRAADVASAALADG